MLNTTVIKGGATTNYQHTTFNTPCTGLIQKSNLNSTFIRFAKGSEMEKMLFPANGKDESYLAYTTSESRVRDNSKFMDYYKIEHKVPVIVLQVMLFGDNQFLCEVVNKDDYFEQLGAIKIE